MQIKKDERNEIKSTSHSRYRCQYHIVFAPKYRREAVRKILRQLREWKGVKIVRAEVCSGYIHMLVEIPPKMAVSSFMGYLKEKSSTMLYD